MAVAPSRCVEPMTRMAYVVNAPLSCSFAFDPVIYFALCYRRLLMRLPNSCVCVLGACTTSLQLRCAAVSTVASLLGCC